MNSGLDANFIVYGAGFTLRPTVELVEPNVIANTVNEPSFTRINVCCTDSGNAVVTWNYLTTSPALLYATEYRPGNFPILNELITAYDGNNGDGDTALTCCNCNAFALWANVNDLIQSSYLTLNQTILGINQSNQNCIAQTETVTVSTCGDPTNLEFQLDNGYPQSGNPIFNNVGNGSHIITVTDPSDPYVVPATFCFKVNIPP